MRGGRFSWLVGGIGLIGCGVAGIIRGSVLGASGTSTVLALLADVLWAAAILVFAIGLSREGSVVDRKPLGVAASAAVALWPLTDTLLNLFAGPTALEQGNAWLAWEYVSIVLPLMFGLIAAMQVARAGLVPAPWNWAPLWALGLQTVTWLLPQLIGVASPTVLIEMSDALLALRTLSFLTTTLGLGILAILLSHRSRVETVPIFQASPREQPLGTPWNDSTTYCQEIEQMFILLNMRSASEDLTTRARIRDAAIECFARGGFSGTSLRQIAGEANVSAALIVHHFGGKDGLRDACDEFVVASFMDENEAITGTAAADMMRAALDTAEQRSPMLEYMMRMLVDTTAASDRLFDAFLAGTREMLERQIAAGIMRPQPDLDATAVYMTLYGLGPVLLQRHLARAFGEERLTTQMLERSTLPVLELFTHGLYTDDRLLVAARDALQRRNGPRSDKGENDPNQDPDPPQ